MAYPEHEVDERSFKIKQELDRANAVAKRSKQAKRELDAAAEAKRRAMKEEFVPISDAITLIANQQFSDATNIMNDLLGNRVLGSLEERKQEIAQSLFAPGAESLAENTLRAEKKKSMKEEYFIKNAIKHPGALHKSLHVPSDKKIPAKKLDAAAHKGGKLGKRARFAKLLRSFHHE